MTLLPPSRFRPWSKGVYDVSPSLKPLGFDFGNGEADRHLTQIDSDFPKFRANRLAAYRDCRSKYWGIERLAEETSWAAVSALGTTLARDYPDWYSWDGETLENRITDEVVRLRGDLPGEVDHALEAMAWQIQADLALIVREPDGLDRVAAISVCAPSHWEPASKLGQSFFQTHAEIPGFSRINAIASNMVDAMISKGPFVRFVWGVESDDRLNHHPVPPPGEEPVEWDGRIFDRGRFWGRYERQTLLGLPSVNAALFLIHVHTVPDHEILGCEEDRASLLAAVESMSPEARRYKGLAKGFDSLRAMLGG